MSGELVDVKVRVDRKCREKDWKKILIIKQQDAIL